MKFINWPGGRDKKMNYGNSFQQNITRSNINISLVKDFNDFQCLNCRHFQHEGCILGLPLAINRDSDVCGHWDGEGEP